MWQRPHQAAPPPHYSTPPPPEAYDLVQTHTVVDEEEYVVHGYLAPHAGTRTELSDKPHDTTARRTGKLSEYSRGKHGSVNPFAPGGASRSTALDAPAGAAITAEELARTLCVLDAACDAGDLLAAPPGVPWQRGSSCLSRRLGAMLVG